MPNLDWQGPARRYLERLGMAEWEAQGRPVPKPKGSGVKGATRGRYCPSEYHTNLIGFLDRNDESGFKALKLEQGYSTAVGV